MDSFYILQSSVLLCYIYDIFLFFYSDFVIALLDETSEVQW